MISGRLSAISTITGRLSGRSRIFGSLTVPRAVGTEFYHGSYEWTPNEETQIIEIEDLTALQDIVINPIPDNYGRIAWNGYKLRVY